jgi:drug/metabolite transporter (DMT)-like permease
VFIALALAWGVVVDGFKPDRWDLLGALICVAGVVLMVAPTRVALTLFTRVRGRGVLRGSDVPFAC